MKPLIAIIGRPNVGKSTLFNRLSEGKKAIAIDQPGATRDRNYTEASWQGKAFDIVDTGGFEPVSTEKILMQMREQTRLAMEQCDLIIFLMDGREGLTPSDEEIAKLLRTYTKPSSTPSTRSTGPARQSRLRVLPPRDRPGLHHLRRAWAGVDELMDALRRPSPVRRPQRAKKRRRESGSPSWDAQRGEIVPGQQNPGLRAHDREPDAGNDAGCHRHALRIPRPQVCLVDTAGIRRKSRISLTLEKYSVIEALRTLNRCDIAFCSSTPRRGSPNRMRRSPGSSSTRGWPASSW